MKRLGDILLRQDTFAEVLLGNHAVARALLESGVRVVTAYPGSPTPEIADGLAAVPAERRGCYFEFSTNEKVATELAIGAALGGRLSCVFFKSVGLNVAADSLVQAPLLDLPGGMVVILGDDPGANSSQNEQDNRRFAQMAMAPLLEPASPSEAYRMCKEAAALAVRHRTVVFLRLTTHVCHAKERIDFDAWTPVPAGPAPRFTGGPDCIPLAERIAPLKRKALARLAAIAGDEAVPRLVRRYGSMRARRGIIVAGHAVRSVLDVLSDLPVEARPDVLALGLVLPLPRAAVAEFLRGHAEVRVIEELDDVLEKDIKALAWDLEIPCKVRGKLADDDFIGEYVPDRVHDLLRAGWPDLLPPRDTSLPPVGVPARPAQLCPGCGHRSAFHAIRGAYDTLPAAVHDRVLFVGDIGCHILGYLPPYELGSVILSMGHAPATASGLALADPDRIPVCFLGDSTFFHAGMPPLVNACFNKHDLLLVLLENGTTAMTGHQDHAASGHNWNGPVDALPVRRALEGLGISNIREIDAYRQKELAAMFTEAVTETGVRAIIARHPCMLKFDREQRRKPGYRKKRVAIDPATCTFAHDCVSRFACPSFRIEDGKVVDVHPDLCIGDGSCRQVCPANAITAPKAVDGEGA